MRPVVALYSPMLQVSEKPLPAFVTNRFPPDTAMPIGKLFNPETNKALAHRPACDVVFANVGVASARPKEFVPERFRAWHRARQMQPRWKEPIVYS
jgi:hypothetical protein